MAKRKISRLKLLVLQSGLILVFIFTVYKIIELGSPWDGFFFRLKSDVRPKWIQYAGRKMSYYVKSEGSSSSSGSGNASAAAAISGGLSFIIESDGALLRASSDFQDVVPLAVIFIITLPESRSRRDGIRISWFKWKQLYNFRLVFFMGLPKNEALIPAIQSEAAEYNDLIMAPHEENYYALPMKVLYAMKYFLQLCHTGGGGAHSDRHCQSTYFIKMDDDVFLNIPNLNNYLLSLSLPGQATASSEAAAQNFYGGALTKFPKANHNADSTMYITYELWPNYWYPPFIDGSFYVISGQLISTLYETALGMDYFPFEDVFFSGLVAYRVLGLTLTKMDGVTKSYGNELTKYDPKFTARISMTPLKTEAGMSQMFSWVSGASKS